MVEIGCEQSDGAVNLFRHYLYPHNAPPVGIVVL